MRNTLSATLQRVVVLLTVLLIVKVTIAVIWGYRNYFPPDFQADFLRGRQHYFFGSYGVAFYAHIAAGPVSLILGLLLISQRFRRKFPAWHRRLGRVQGIVVLLVVAPSGWWMAWYASTGAIASIGFMILAVLTALCAVFGWRAAVQKRIDDHRRWMSRCFLLLSSAVVIRVLGGLGTVLEVEAGWFNPAASWASWLVPLAVFELNRLRQRRSDRSRVKSAASQNRAALQPPAAAVQSRWSAPPMEINARRSAAGASAEMKCTLPSTKAACTPSK